MSTSPRFGSGAAMGTIEGGDARGRLLAELAAGPARRGYAIAYDLLRNRSEAEEAVQDALAVACEHIADLRDPAAAGAWFLHIVTTTCLRTLRRRRLRRALLGRFGGSRSDDGEPSENGERNPDDVAWLVHGNSSLTPGGALERRQKLAALLGSLDGLSANQRAALLLRYGHDMPVPEVASMLGVEAATAKTHLVRGLSRLRDLMEEYR